MERTTKLIFEGKEFEFPIGVGTEDEEAISIEKLCALTGLIILDSGYKSTGSCKSTITSSDGECGILRYRDYSTENLVANVEFLEVAYLPTFGELPIAEEYDRFKKTIHKYTTVHGDMHRTIDDFPRSVHPMRVLSSATSALTAFNPVPVNVKCNRDVYQAVCKAIAELTIIATWVYRKRGRLPLDYYKSSMGYIENILRSPFGTPSEEYSISPTIVNALNKLLILHSDHEQNCSASTIRLADPSEAGLFASISSGASALWGRLYGGANRAVIKMPEEMKANGGGVDKFINKARDKNDPSRLMDFGHHVYKNSDPRVKTIKKAADDVLRALGIDDPIFDIVKHLGEVALENEYFKGRDLYPDADSYSGIIYKVLGMHLEMFMVPLVIGRLPSQITQWKEMRQGGKPIDRPRQIYTGVKERAFIALDK